MALQREALRARRRADRAGRLDAADAEDELRDRMEDLDVPRPWKLAEPLAAAGVDAGWLDRVAALAGPGHGRRAALGGGDAHRPRRWPTSCASRPSA